MITSAINLEMVRKSVWSVPPLARASDNSICPTANKNIMRHIEAGGISTLLYGGNAIFYHLKLKEFASALEVISQQAAQDSLVIPSVGPAYGTMLDQLPILQEFQFPTVMILPQSDVVSSAGIAKGVRNFAEKFGKPVVLYLKFDRKVTAEDASKLVNDGIISAIKFAVVRDDHSVDAYLKEMTSVIDPNMIISGMGEQPAIIHLRDFGLGGFTTGCGCIAPKLSSSLLTALHKKNWAEAEKLRTLFEPLEDLRNAWGPIAVLHTALKLAGIADTGPITPLLSELSTERNQQIEIAAKSLLDLDNKH